MLWILLSNFIINKKNLILIAVITFLPFLSSLQKVSFLLLIILESIRAVLYLEHKNNSKIFYKNLPVGNTFQLYNILVFETGLLIFALVIFGISWKFFYSFNIEDIYFLILGVYFTGGLISLLSFLFAPDKAIHILLTAVLVIYIFLSIFISPEYLFIVRPIQFLLGNKFIFTLITVTIYLFQFIFLKFKEER